MPQAWHDLLDIGYTYERVGSKLEAYAVTCNIVRQLKELCEFALLGEKTPLRKLNEKKYMLLKVGQYDCIYRKIEDKIYVYHITELQQDYPKLLK